MRQIELWSILSAGGLEELLNTLSQLVARSKMFRGINGYFDARNPLVNEISRRMDGNMRLGLDPVSGWRVSPNTHRLVLDGHTVWRSWQLALEVSSQLGEVRTKALGAWMLAYIQDLSSPAGVPIVELARHIYFELREAGVKEETARRITTVNGEKSVKALLALLMLPAALVARQDKQEATGQIGPIDGLAHSLVQGRPASLILSSIAVVRTMRSSKDSSLQIQRRAVGALAIGIADAAIARYGARGMVLGLLALLVANRLESLGKELDESENSQ